MTLDSSLVLLAIALVVLVVLYLLHNHLLTGAVAAAKAELTKVETTVKADLPDIEADAVAAGQKFLLWATDTSQELAAKAALDATIAKKNTLAAHTATALAARAAAPTVMPPAA